MSLPSTNPISRTSKILNEVSFLRNQHGLVLSVSGHGSISIISDQVQMWWHLILLLASVEVDHLHGVQWQPLERIDGNAKQTGVRIDIPVDVSFPQVVVHGGVIQIRQISHVIAFFVLHWVLLEDAVSFNCDGLKQINQLLKNLEKTLKAYATKRLHLLCGMF